MMERLNKKYGQDSGTPAFREGYDRGQHYLVSAGETYNARGERKKESQKAA